jgi:hypothetical protein
MIVGTPNSSHMLPIPELYAVVASPMNSVMQFNMVVMLRLYHCSLLVKAFRRHVDKTNRIPIEWVFFVARSKGQHDILLAFMVDQFREGQRHVALHRLDGTAIRIDLFDIGGDVFATRDSAYHGLAFFIANDLLVQFCFGPSIILKLTVHSGQKARRPRGTVGCSVCCRVGRCNGRSMCCSCPSDCLGDGGISWRDDRAGSWRDWPASRGTARNSV